MLKRIVFCCKSQAFHRFPAGLALSRGGRALSSEMSTKHLKQGDLNPPVNKDVLRIYNMRYCPFAQRVLLVLSAKGVSHEIVNCNLREKPEFLLERNPAGKVPVLEYQGHVVQESLVISDLLEELFPEKPLAAKDPYQKAKDRLAVDNFGQVISNFYKFCQNRDDDANKAAFEKSLFRFQNLLMARKTPYLGGDQCGMADLMVWPWFERMLVLDEASLDPYPDLRAYASRMASVPAVQSCMVPKANMVRFYQSYYSGSAVYDFE